MDRVRTETYAHYVTPCLDLHFSDTTLNGERVDDSRKHRASLKYAVYLFHNIRTRNTKLHKVNILLGKRRIIRFHIKHFFEKMDHLAQCVPEGKDDENYGYESMNYQAFMPQKPTGPDGQRPAAYEFNYNIFYRRKTLVPKLVEFKRKMRRGVAEAEAGAEAGTEAEEEEGNWRAVFEDESQSLNLLIILAQFTAHGMEKLGIQRNAALGYKMFESLYNQNKDRPTCALLMAVLLIFARDDERDIEKARRLLQESADAGIENAKSILDILDNIDYDEMKRHAAQTYIHDMLMNSLAEFRKNSLAAAAANKKDEEKKHRG